MSRQRMRAAGLARRAPHTLLRFVHRSSRARLCRRYCSCLEATASVRMPELTSALSLIVHRGIAGGGYRTSTPTAGATLPQRRLLLLSGDSRFEQRLPLAGAERHSGRMLVALGGCRGPPASDLPGRSSGVTNASTPMLLARSRRQNAQDRFAAGVRPVLIRAVLAASGGSCWSRFV
jgi:hypothetical protein